MLTETRPAPLTERQAELYRYIFEYTCEHGYQPSIRGICEHFGMKSPNSVAAHLRPLAKKGWVASPNLQSRALRFLYTPNGERFKGFTPESN